MGRFIVISSLVSVLLLEVGSIIAPQYPVMWLATSSIGIEIIRALVVIILAVFLMTDPPRHPMLRMVAGVVAGVVLVTVLTLTYQNHVSILDSISLMAASVSMGIMSLEINQEETERPAKATQQRTVRHTRAMAH